MFYLVIILFGVGWILLSIIRNYVSSKNAISNKYLNHGKNVPVQKYSNFNVINPLKNKAYTLIRTYSTFTNKENHQPETKGLNEHNKDISSPLVYVDAHSKVSSSLISSVLIEMREVGPKKDIIKENIGKSGVYMWTNLRTGDIYIGQSADLSKRFSSGRPPRGGLEPLPSLSLFQRERGGVGKYFTICPPSFFLLKKKGGVNFFSLTLVKRQKISFIKSRKELIISRALLKYGYENFSVAILEYCDKSDLTVREQYYLDKFNPQYNILKIAGSSLGFKQSEVTKEKISKAFKGIYIGDKSALFGRTHTEETKKKMSLSRTGENNPLYGKTHSVDSKELMRQKALGRKHSSETIDKMSKTHGNTVNIYEKCSSEGFKLIGSFVSARRAAKFLDMSGSTVIRYMQSGGVYKDRYKFSSK